MRHYQFALCLIAATVLVGCGGSSSDTPPTKVQFSSQASFGDSLSDLGTYKVGTILNLRGGQFNINGNGGGDGALTGKNFTELLAAQFNLPAPCPNQTGLQGDPSLGFSAPVVIHPECTSYAQGGSRVLDPNGIGHTGPIGALTVPVTTQIQNHLAANGGRFKADALIVIQGGPNDFFTQFGILGAGAAAAKQAATATGGTAAGEAAELAFVTANAPAIVPEMGRVGAAFGNLIKTEIVGKGANFVVVANIPPIQATPFGLDKTAAERDLIRLLITTFNAQLLGAIKDEPKILHVDAYTATLDFIANPGIFGLTNVTTKACDTNPARNALGGAALVCTPSNLITGAGDVSQYLFADDVHPTPYGYLLFARQVSKDMVLKGWL